MESKELDEILDFVSDEASGFLQLRDINDECNISLTDGFFEGCAYLIRFRGKFWYDNSTFCRDVTVAFDLDHAQGGLKLRPKVQKL